MLFSSITFLYIFLPATLLCYFASPKRFRNFVLLFASLIFYFCGEPRYLLIMLFAILSGYLHGIIIERAKTERGKSLALFSGTLLALAALGVFKYADFFLGSVSTLLHTDLPLLKLALPIGISFYTFQIISYLIDVRRADVPAQYNFVSFAAYVALFAQLIAGPIVRYADINEKLSSRTESFEQFGLGVRRFILGLAKKVLLANTFAELVARIEGAPTTTVLGCWLSAGAFMLQIYFDFSGYSDMAIGLSRLFGFHFAENFDYPYTSKSVTEFWRRWHISLGSWFRDYVYIPLGGNRVSRFRHIVNILIVWLLTGLWHGAAWNFVLWGLYFAAFLLLEKFFLQKRLQKSPSAVSHIYTLFVVLFGFVLFSASDVGAALATLFHMFGGGNLAAADVSSLYYLRSFLPMLALGAFASAPFAKRLFERLCRIKWIEKSLCVLEPAALIALLLICTAYLIEGSFNPFLYFRF